MRRIGARRRMYDDSMILVWRILFYLSQKELIDEI